MVIRVATPNDLAPVRRLLVECGLPPEGLEDQFGEGYAVAAENGEVIGAAGMERHGCFGLLRSVATAPGQRGRGIGQALTRDRMGWAERQGLQAVYLLTTTASGYFHRLGFAPVARESVPAEIRESREFSTVCHSSAVVMGKVFGR